jgi:hypothetical protein
MTGRTLSQETLQRMSKSQRLVDRSGANHPFYGITHGEEAIAKMSEAKKGANNPIFGKFGITPALRGML